VMDFSEAERNGFIEAFVNVRKANDDARTLEELSEAAISLLKGCREHFRANITRISCIHGVVSPERVPEFKKRMLALLNCGGVHQFRKDVQTVLYDFPLARPWLNWYLRESTASMLFVSKRTMEPAIWDSMSETTNAAEAQHWKIYCTQGRDHLFENGLYSLHAVAESYDMLFKASTSRCTYFNLNITFS
ncbi:hypothetical protein BDQ17DRAFT_1257419, partial [Cyathus striatus]